jgi:hypothetical protein
MNLKSGEIILSILFIVYLLIGTKTPLFIADGVNTMMGKFVLLFIAIIFFIYANPIVSVLLIVVIYELIIRSKQYVNTTYQQGLQTLAQYPEDTTLIYCPDNTLKEVPRTLEQDVVEQMAPICNTNNQMMTASYKPVVESVKNAASVISVNS